MANELAMLFGVAGAAGLGMLFYMESVVMMILDILFVALNAVYAVFMVMDTKRNTEVMPK
ncbi:hypothetical protein GF351_05725 [Candidatus Woesearchaeota archaeon]|nr:hypothetical protein [Candidatus Woesearchaeota archaeon]